MIIRSEDTLTQLELRPSGVGGSVIVFAVAAAGPYARCTLDEVAFFRSDLQRFCAEVERFLGTPVGTVTLRAKTPGGVELRLMSGGRLQRLALQVELGWGHSTRDLLMHDRLALTLAVTPTAVAEFAAELGAAVSLHLSQGVAVGAMEDRSAGR